MRADAIGNTVSMDEGSLAWENKMVSRRRLCPMFCMKSYGQRRVITLMRYRMFRPTTGPSSVDGAVSKPFEDAAISHVFAGSGRAGPVARMREAQGNTGI